MIRSIVQRLKCLTAPSIAWLDRRAAHHHCALQAYMDIDERNSWFPVGFRQQFGGFHPPGEKRDYQRTFPSDGVRSDMLALLLREIVSAGIPGVLAELGVHLGGSARLIHHYCPERRFYLLDTFQGFSAEDLQQESVHLGFNQHLAFDDTTITLVRRNIQPVADTLKFVAGRFPASATVELAAETFAFVHLDADLEAPIAAGLDFFWPRLSPGGMIVVHDYNAWPGARIAVDRFRKTQRVVAVPMPDKAGSIVLVK